VARWPIEGPRSSLEALHETVDFAARRGIEDVRLGTMAVIMNRLADIGLLDEVSSEGAELVDLAETAGDVYAIMLARPALMRVAVVRGDLPEARAIVESSIREAREIGDTQIFALVFPPAAALALARGEEDEPIELLSELERTANSRDDYDYVSSLPSSVRTAIAAGDGDLARRLVSEVRPVFPLHEHSLASAEALLVESDGRHDEAARRFADASARWERFGVPYERAQALFGQGRCFLASSRLSEALSPLRLAREIFAGLQAQPALRAMEALFKRADIEA
jgi:ATP/maltotriose-dependent transcriptional regulator MalT